MSIQNSKRLSGKYRPPADSEHNPKAKTIHRGICSDTGFFIHFYENGGVRHRISNENFQNWRKVRK